MSDGSYMELPPAFLRITRELHFGPGHGGRSDGGLLYKAEVVRSDGIAIARLSHVTGYALDDSEAHAGRPARGTVHMIGLEVDYKPNFIKDNR